MTIVLDTVAFAWIKEHLFSQKVRRAFELRESLADHVSPGSWVLVVSLVVSAVIIAALCWLVASRVIMRLQKGRTVCFLFAVPYALAFLFALWPLWRAINAQEPLVASARHPLAVFGVYRSETVQPVAVEDSGERFGYVAAMIERLAKRDQRQLDMSIQKNDLSTKQLPDVVFVVIESLRPELVDPEVMPTLAKFAEKGLHCKQHHSTGNATTHGMFGLFNGLEAIWYSRPIRNRPMLNRLLHQAGYEIGFFAGHNDWRKFRMEGYVNKQHYDVFEVHERNWLLSDRRATEQAISFLQRSDLASDQPRRPRLAVLYLYSTHANYHSYTRDQIFQPAADLRFTIPYSESSAPMVWNRYKNSARSIDGFLKAILAEDRVAIVTGDHGESFLEDGTCGHGSRLSKYQNMTPAVIYFPGKPPRKINKPTIHADILPTLVAGLGLKVDDEEAWDGLDLNVQDQRLNDRVIATRDYLSDEFALIDAGDETQAWGFKCALRLRDFQSTLNGAIDDSGHRVSVAGEQSELLNRWLTSRLIGSSGD